MSDQDVHGPIDYLLVQFGDGALGPDTVDAVLDLVDRKIIYLYDVLALRAGADGTVSPIDLHSLTPDEMGGIAALAGAQTGLLGDDDLADAGAALDPGALGVLLVYENAWSIPFVGAALRSGGQVIASQRIPAQAVMDALDAADATN
jgi:hypothetical protein